MKDARDWVAHLEAHLPLALSGEDPEGVHQVRVAGRRLRAYLELLGFRVLKDDLRFLVRQAGRVRDLEVALGRPLPEGFREHLRAELAEARRSLVALLRSPWMGTLLRALRHLPPWTKGRLGSGLGACRSAWRPAFWSLGRSQAWSAFTLTAGPSGGCATPRSSWPFCQAGEGPAGGFGGGKRPRGAQGPPSGLPPPPGGPRGPELPGGVGKRLGGRYPEGPRGPRPRVHPSGLGVGPPGVEGPEPGSFLALMGLHPGQDLIQESYGLQHMGSLVDHDALRPGRQGGVGKLRPLLSLPLQGKAVLS
jgi:hypothetical protein